MRPGLARAMGLSGLRRARLERVRRRRPNSFIFWISAPPDRGCSGAGGAATLRPVSGPDFLLEDTSRGLVAGIDEAGRGPLAGPVVAAAVVLDGPFVPDGIDDSKKLSSKAREEIFGALSQTARIGVGAASVAEIDRLNILGATLLAMSRALARLSRGLGRTPDLALVDGNRAPHLPCAVETVVGGDARSLSIAAASIVAKVTRDRLMASLGSAHPGYGWEHNAGYGTLEHRLALTLYGPTPHHRLSFSPVRPRLASPRPLELPLSL